MKKRYISEAVGVPENIIESAIKLYEYFYTYVSSMIINHSIQMKKHIKDILQLT